MGCVAAGGLLRHPRWGHINPTLDFLAKLEIINGNVSKGSASVLRTAVADNCLLNKFKKNLRTSEGGLKLSTLTEE